MTDEYENFDTANEPEPKTEKPAEAPAEAPQEAAADGDKDDEAKSWQSKADKAEARANRLERELDELRRTQSVEGSSSTAKPKADGSEDPWVAASKDNFRDDLYRSDPRLKALGFDADLIQGSTPAEMRKSLASLQGSVDRMESGIRNRVLAEHGLEPVPGSGERATGVNYRTMPTDEFNKLVEKQMQG